MLDISPLPDSRARYQRNIYDEQIRDELIQRFRFTYELSHSTCQIARSGPSAPMPKSPRTLFRPRSGDHYQYVLGR